MSMTPVRPERPRLTNEEIREVVLEAMRNANLARDAASQLVVTPDAALFGPDSPLDSLGLVALLLDIEEGFQQSGWSVLLSDERAMSQRRSPFRTVESLISYIAAFAGE
jgi:acyl carrier protein